MKTLENNRESTELIVSPTLLLTEKKWGKLTSMTDFGVVAVIQSDGLRDCNYTISLRITFIIMLHIDTNYKFVAKNKIKCNSNISQLT